MENHPQEYLNHPQTNIKHNFYLNFQSNRATKLLLELFCSAVEGKAFFVTNQVHFYSYFRIFDLNSLFSIQYLVLKSLLAFQNKTIALMSAYCRIYSLEKKYHTHTHIWSKFK